MKTETTEALKERTEELQKFFQKNVTCNWNRYKRQWRVKTKDGRELLSDQAILKDVKFSSKKDSAVSVGCGGGTGYSGVADGILCGVDAIPQAAQGKKHRLRFDQAYGDWMSQRDDGRWDYFHGCDYLIMEKGGHAKVVNPKWGRRR
jgi:hypothetical protein